jgi:hypothetical protein
LNMRRSLPRLLLAAAILLGCGQAETTGGDGDGGEAGSPLGGNQGDNPATGGDAGRRDLGEGGGGTSAGDGSAKGGAANGGAAGVAGSASGGMAGSGAGGAGGTDAGGAGGAVSSARAKFHLYLMIGQSNMEGTGQIFAEDVIAPPRVLKFTSDMKWIPGNEPTAIGRIGRGVGETGVSMGRTFAIEMMVSQTDPDVTVGLMNLAVSGSPIQSWFDPPPTRTSDPTRPYDMNYARMLPYLREALKTGVLKGVLWHQGEANGSADIGLYLPQLIQNLRNEVKNPTLPVVIGEVGITTLTDSKNKALAKVAAEVPQVGLATCENLLFKEGMTGVHYDTPSYREYGRRYAVVMKKLIAASP